MLRASLRFHHKIRDRGGNGHNFAFDTLTMVYRDAVYAKDKRHTGNPMNLRDEEAASSSAHAPSGDDSAAVSQMGEQLTQRELKGKEAVVGSNASSSSSSPPSESAAEVRRGPRRSGVQMEILRLYRDLMKETRRMEDSQTRTNLRRFIRTEFDENATIPRKFVTRIEWQLHHGKNKLEELRGMRPNTRFSLMH